MGTANQGLLRLDLVLPAGPQAVLAATMGQMHPQIALAEGILHHDEQLEEFYMLNTKSSPIASPNVVLREEFDDWAILFDPESGDAFGLNPVSVLIWKAMDGKNTVSDITHKIKENCTDVPDEVNEHVNEFVKSLVDKGFVGFAQN